MKNNKAFTLTEIIAVLAIIGVILTIAIPASSNLMANNKEKEYTLYVETVEKAVLAYADMECGVGDNTVLIQSLIDKRYLDSKPSDLTTTEITFNKEASGKVTFSEDDLELKFKRGNIEQTCTKDGCE